MNHSDLVALLEGGIDNPGGSWADLGAGEGAFTFALAELLGPRTQIIALDKDARALSGIREEMARRFPDVRFSATAADFTRRLQLSDLDGMVMANSLHFVRDSDVLTPAEKEAILGGTARRVLGWRNGV